MAEETTVEVTEEMAEEIEEVAGEMVVEIGEEMAAGMTAHRDPTTEDTEGTIRAFLWRQGLHKIRIVGSSTSS